MPLSLVVAEDGGRSGLALRRHRGDHELRATGPSSRLQSILPSLITAHADGSVIVPFVVLMEDDARAELFFNQMVGFERLCAALDALINLVADNSPLHPSVFRAQLRTIARRLHTENTAALVVAVADFYSVGPSVFPQGDGVDLVFDWMGCLRYGDLLDAEGSLSIVALLEAALAPRFDSAVTLAVDGPLDRLASAVTKSVGEVEVPVLRDITHADALAVELAAWIDGAWCGVLE